MRGGGERIDGGRSNHLLQVVVASERGRNKPSEESDERGACRLKMLQLL